MRLPLPPVLISAIGAFTALACARHVSQERGQALPSAGLRAGPAAVVTLTVPGTPQADWNTIVQALTDSSYRFADGDYYAGVLSFRSLKEGRLVRVQMLPISGDSVSVVVTGLHYIGDARRPGVILASDSAWPDIYSTDAAAAAVDLAGARIRAAFTPSQRLQPTAPPTPGRQFALLEASPDSLLRDLGNGRKAFCRANTVRRDQMVVVDNVNLSDWCLLSSYDAARLKNNTYVLEDPLRVAIGTTLDVCSISRIPAGFAVVEWFTDPSHCPFDPSWIWKREPNMMRLTRVR